MDRAPPSTVSPAPTLDHRWRLLYEVTALAAAPPRQRLERALRVMTESLGMRIGIVSRVVDDTYTVEHACAPPGEVTAGQTFPLGVTYCSLLLDRRDVLALHHMGGSEHAGHPCYEAMGLEAYIGARVLVGGEPFGTLNFSSPEPRAEPFGPEDEGLVELLARWVGATLEAERAEAAKRKSEARFRTSFDDAPLGMAVAGDDGRFVEVNDELCRIVGYEREELLGRSFRDLTHPDDLEESVAQFRALIAAGRGRYQLEKRYLRKDGEVIWTRVNVTAVRDEEGAFRYFLGHVEDVTEQREREARYETVVGSLHEGVLLVDGAGAIVEANPAATRILGVPRERLLDRDRPGPGWEVVREDGSPQPDDEGPVASVRATGGPHSGVLGLDRPGRERVWLRVSARPVHPGRPGTPVVVSFEDVTDRKAREDELAYGAYHDPLTGLPNRRALFERAEAAFGDRERREKVVDAVLYLDLDRFKRINDTYNHAVGDALLVEVARRLRDAVRPGDLVARIAGDEFGVLLTDVRDVRQAMRVSRRVLAAFETPCQVGEIALQANVSIGLALAERAHDSGEGAIHRADLALRRAKRAGRGQVVVYEQDLDREVKRLVGLEHDLAEAFRRDELEVHYQPIVDLGSGEPYGAEALMRWHHPERGYVPPLEFIPVAEESGLIVDLGLWQVERSFAHLAEWRGRHPGMRLGLNLSPRQLESDAFLEELVARLEHAPFPAEAVVLELTETYLMRDVRASAERLEELAMLGVGIAIDDFGTGYSSLSYLQHLPITHVKVDRSFLAKAPDERRNRVLVEAVLSLAEKLGLRAVAEGIETGDQADFLKGLGCRWGQGYLYARPMPPDAFEAFLAAQLEPADD